MAALSTIDDFYIFCWFQMYKEVVKILKLVKVAARVKIMNEVSNFKEKQHFLGKWVMFGVIYQHNNTYFL